MSNVRVMSDGLWSGTHIMVGDQEIRATAMEIIAKDGKILLKLETSIDILDIETKDGNTELIIKPMVGGKDKRVRL